MNLKKRSDGELEQTSEAEESPSTGKKPVVVYIMMLFLVAFLLMAVSLLMHQRNNTEALGELQTSISAMKEIQSSQDKIIILQEELEAAQMQADQLEAQLLESEAATELAQLREEALLALYTLQQEYAAGHYDACRSLVEDMAANEQVFLLSQASINGVTPPAQRYQQIKEALEKH